MRIEPEISGASVVLLGSFNPAIFTPAWFGLQGVLPRTAVESAERVLVQPGVTKFSFDWLNLSVRPGQFIADTAQAPLVRLSDLVVRTFRNLLPHTPVTAIGINRIVHFRVQDESQRTRIGRELAPTPPWGEWGRRIAPDGAHGGMASLTMRQQGIEGRPSGDQINVTVEPSVKLGDTGVYVHVNDHYTAGGEERESGSVLIERLARAFPDSVERSESLIDQVMSVAEGRA